MAMIWAKQALVMQFWRSGKNMNSKEYKLQSRAVQAKFLIVEVNDL